MQSAPLHLAPSTLHSPHPHAGRDPNITTSRKTARYLRSSPHAPPQTLEEESATRQFLAVGVWPRHLTEQLQFKNLRAYALEGTGQLGPRPTWRRCCPNLSSSRGYSALWHRQPVPHAAQCVPFLCPQDSAEGPGAKPNSSCCQEPSSSQLCASQRGPGPLLVLTFSSHLCTGTSPLSTTQRSLKLFPPEHQRPTPTPVAALGCLPGPQAHFRNPRRHNCPSGFFMVFLVCVGQCNF